MTKTLFKKRKKRKICRLDVDLSCQSQADRVLQYWVCSHTHQLCCGSCVSSPGGSSRSRWPLSPERHCSLIPFFLTTSRARRQGRGQPGVEENSRNSLPTPGDILSDWRICPNLLLWGSLWESLIMCQPRRNKPNGEEVKLHTIIKDPSPLPFKTH